MPGVLERRGEDVDLRWWRGWRCLGERERRRRGLGVEDGYGRRGEREGEVDMGRRWRARWRPGEREWWLRGLEVVDGYGWRGERGARRGVLGEGEVDVGRQWRAWLRRGEREWWWRGLGGRWGEGEGDMGRRWRSWWCPEERERRERGPGGRGGTWGSGSGASGWLRRGGSVGAVGECAVRGGSGSAAACGTGPRRSSRASPEASAASGGARAAPQCPGCGHWVSYCCVVFVFGSGWRLGAGFVNPVSPGWGLGWVFLGSICGVVPLVSAICGVRGWATVSACFWDVCGFVGALLAPLPFPVPARGVGVCAGPGSRLCPVRLGWVVGVCVFFLRFGFFFSFFFFWVLWSPSLHSLSFGLGWWLSFFFFFFPCPFSPWSAVTGLVLPVLGGWFPCASAGVPPPFFFSFFFFPGGGAWPPVVVLAGGWAAVGCFRAFSPSPLLFFFFFSFWGGLACSPLCLPWAGARTGLYSVLSSGLLSSVAFCVAMSRPHGSGGLCTRWARRPFLLG